MDSPGQTVSVKSEKFEMELGRLAPASEVAEGLTYLTILKIAWSADSPVTSEAGARCHSKITTKSEKGNLTLALLVKKGGGRVGSW
jgi:hypothetical protein